MHLSEHVMFLSPLSVSVCVRVCIFLLLPSACGNSHLTQLSYSLLLFLRVADNVMRRCDSSWDEASHLIPLSLLIYLPLSPSPSVCVPGSCLCAWFSSIGWLTWESQWHRCPQAKTRLDEQRHTFLPLPLPRWAPPPCVWSYLCLPISGDVDWVSSAEGCLCKSTFITLISFLAPGRKHTWYFLFVFKKIPAFSHHYTSTLFKTKWELFCVQILRFTSFFFFLFFSSACTIYS